jgi:hypothetical protein
MKVQIYRAADAKQHADKVAAAAMRAGIARIVADNGNAYVDIEPCPWPKDVQGETPLFAMDGMCTTPAILQERAEWQDFIDTLSPAGENTVGRITGSGAYWTIRDIADEVNRWAADDAF